MTGYGKGEHEENGIKFIVEVKSVNHRYNDLSIRAPRLLSSLEERIRELASSYTRRGKVDIYINYHTFDQDVKIEIDRGLVKSYIECFNTIKEEFSVEDDIRLSLITRFPDILRVEKAEIEDDIIWNVLKIALKDALELFSQMREREGARLYRDISNKIKLIDKMIYEIESITKNSEESNKDKFYKRIKDLAGDVSLDENRLIAEVVILADKSSIDEEIVRFKSHIEEFIKTINGKVSSGKKLDFIIQEMNREVNTIAAKANELGIINNVVNIKAEIEKIREQVQNIE